MNDKLVFPRKGSYGPAGIVHEAFGLTKREYFASLAMLALLASPELLQVITAAEVKDGKTAAYQVAEASTKYADALLDTLNYSK